MSDFEVFRVSARTELDDGTYEYSLTQVTPDIDAAGGYAEAVPSLEATAYEANNALVEVGSHVAARYKHTSGGHPVYEFFFGSGASRVVVKVTSATVDADGNYPAVTTAWDTTAEVWDDSETVVKLKAANGETLVSDNRYLAVPAGPNANDEQVYVMDGGVVGTIAVEAADGTPAYASVTKLTFDQADGFVLANPSAGVVSVDLQAADDNGTEQNGIVTHGYQRWDGYKVFHGNVSILGGQGTSLAGPVEADCPLSVGIGSGTGQPNNGIEVLSGTFDSLRAYVKVEKDPAASTSSYLQGAVFRGASVYANTDFVLPYAGALGVLATWSEASPGVYSFGNPCYAVLDEDETAQVGVYGTLADGSVVKGGIVTSAGTTIDGGTW